LFVFESEHWSLGHRRDCALPGYLILSARVPMNDLSSLPPEALRELGQILATAQQALATVLNPDHFYIGRFGHDANHPIHFHLIPICGWLKERFFADPRYDAVRQLGSRFDATGTDGAEMTLYVWREFCERPDPPAVSGPQIDDVVKQLRSLIAGGLQGAR
jgi:diadenosine tetraphosphate (Ap4A) HIT family hydrolase